jgi:DNA transformation protein
LAGAGNHDSIVELFSIFGPVTVRRMFSGAGIFAEGLMIALMVDGVIFLKSDAHIVAEFEREGAFPFSYETKNGKPYWRMPERLYDDPDELAGWARRSMEAARRTKSRAFARRSKATRK